MNRARRPKELDDPDRQPEVPVEDVIMQILSDNSDVVATIGRVYLVGPPCRHLFVLVRDDTGASEHRCRRCGQLSDRL